MGSGDSLLYIQYVLTVWPQARRVLPKSFSQSHLDGVFSEPYFVVHRERARTVCEHRVQVLRNETAMTRAIAVRDRGSRTCGAKHILHKSERIWKNTETQRHKGTKERIQCFFTALLCAFVSLCLCVFHPV